MYLIFCIWFFQYRNTLWRMLKQQSFVIMVRSSTGHYILGLNWVWKEHQQVGNINLRLRAIYGEDMKYRSIIGSWKSWAKIEDEDIGQRVCEREGEFHRIQDHDFQWLPARDGKLFTRGSKRQSGIIRIENYTLLLEL